MKKIIITSFALLHVGFSLLAMEASVIPIQRPQHLIDLIRESPFQEGADSKVYVAQLLQQVQAQRAKCQPLPSTQSSVTPPTVINSKELKEGIIWANYTPDGKRLVCSMFGGTDSGSIGVFDAQTLEIKKTFKLKGSGELTASPNNHEIAVSDNNALSLFDIETGKIIKQCNKPGHDQLHYNNDGSRLLVGQGANGIFDCSTGDMVIPLPATSNQAGFYGLDWNPIDDYQIVTCDGASINIFDIRQQKYTQTVTPLVPVGIVRYNNSGSEIMVSAAQQFIALNGKTAAIQAYYDLNGNKSSENKPLPVPSNPTFCGYFLNYIPAAAAGTRDIIITTLENQTGNIIGFDADQGINLFNRPYA